MASVYERLISSKNRQGGGFFLLLDPDRLKETEYCTLADACHDCGVDAILVGSSLLMNSNFGDAVRNIRATAHPSVPVIIMPGSVMQIVPGADAVLFTSLLSGRNPSYLIEQQVHGAPLVKQHGLEPIPTGYLLIESGKCTSVEYMSSSNPIPRTKHDICCAHALAAQYMGMKLVYLEAGSGAEQPVPLPMVTEVSRYVDIPVIVGGGLTTPEECAARIDAGASFVVMGNHFENLRNLDFLRELAASAHPKITVNA
ncbi:MAG: geranylgeranylglyceryl/heptaprenylglyceryl phosphate synthase [Candidatus Zixiibacteriota bacterium]